MFVTQNIFILFSRSGTKLTAWRFVKDRREKRSATQNINVSLFVCR